MKCGPRLEHGGNLKVKESRPRRHMSYGSISNKSSEDTNSIKTEKRLVDVRGWSGETGGGGVAANRVWGSLWGDGKAPEGDTGDGCTAL